MSGPQELIGKRVDVLDRGWIELQDMMGDDLAIVNAARVSFLGESKGPERDKKLLFYLLEHHHTSPFEQVEFKFRVRAPLVTWWQWVRHRTFHYQSVNAQSGRYTPFQENDFYAPQAWRAQARTNKQASAGTVSDEDAAALDALLQEHYARSHALYEQALERGVARELARMFLPAFALYYTWIVKVDALNLMHFLRLRMGREAQYEIRVYARAIYEEFFRPALPWTAEAFERFVLQGEARG